MIRILAAIGVLCLSCSLLLLLFGIVTYLRRPGSPYPPEAAEAPTSVDEHFKTAPREQRLSVAEMDRLVSVYPWSRYATWLKEPS